MLFSVRNELNLYNTVNSDRQTDRQLQKNFNFASKILKLLSAFVGTSHSLQRRSWHRVTRNMHLRNSEKVYKVGCSGIFFFIISYSNHKIKFIRNIRKMLQLSLLRKLSNLDIPELKYSTYHQLRKRIQI